MGRLFGTDGVRGIANTFLTCEKAMEIGRAAAAVLSAGSHTQKPLVLVGYDTRLSSDMLASAISAGLCSVGANVLNLGVVPTPAVAYLIGRYNAQAGVMISASHNPAEFNGIKIFNSEGYKLADALEDRIESMVLDGTPAIELASPTELGTVRYSTTATQDYIEHICTTSPHDLTGLRICMDCACGSASATARTLFTKLGADIHVLSDTPDGLNINKDCGSTHLGQLKKAVLDGKYDAGLAFDGDADRFLAIDELGNEIDGDMIMAILSLDMKARGTLAKNTVVGTIMTNFGFGKFCRENDINFVATKVGDRYVLEEMLLEGYCFGGEQSGHVIFKEFASTGDGQLTAVQLLAHMKRSGKKLSELAKVMTRYPQHMVNIHVSPEGKLAFYTDESVKEVLDDAKNQLGNTGRLVVRPSGTEPLIRIMTEGEDDEKVADLATTTAQKIEKILSVY
ncbi:MAG: phosphoglucosamine mutase [Clostridia bacterium]|nr:phosphoglucosamine mutase [Clostridia bacterium]